MVECFICGSEMHPSLILSDERYETTPKKEFEIYECSECGLGKTHPLPDDLEKYYHSQYYDGLKEKKKLSVIRKIHSKYENLVEPDDLLPNNGKRLLAVGCGPGNKLAQLDLEGWDCTGVEPNKEAAEYAISEHGLDVKNGTLSEVSADLAEEEFDVIIFDHVFEHLPNPNKNLELCDELLAENGDLIIEVPNFDSWDRKLFGKYWGDHDVPRHIYHYTPDSLDRLLDTHGFNLVASSYDGRARLPAGWFTDLLQGRYGMDLPTLAVYPLFIPYGIMAKIFGRSRFRHKYGHQK